jgi:RNA polymerase sigma-70 factor (ECF subfamily)
MMAPEDLGRLIDDHAAALVLYARQWTSAPEDVVQDSFVKLADRRIAPEHAVGWLFTTVRRAAISAARSDRRRRVHETRAAARTASWFVPTEGAGLDAARAAEALAALPLDEREAIIAHLWGGLTFEQIGPLIGLSPATAFRRYQSGLATLRTQMGESCPNPSTIRT